VDNKPETLQAVVKSISLEQLEVSLKCVRIKLDNSPESQTALKVLIGAIVLKREQCLVQLPLF
jgi:hypothetical protein